MISSVEKPKKRSKLRQKAGREYFCLKRRMLWWKNGSSFAREYRSEQLEFAVFQHKSLLLRPLKNVDMYLQRNKVVNLKLAIQHIDGIVIKPGETFSLWKCVGRPTSRKGYLEGMTLHNGQVQSGVGGGLCQLGNLIYWMILHSPLSVTERWRHSYDVFPDVNRKIPFGSGATLSYNYIDLAFENKTNQSYQLKLWLDDTHLRGALFTEKEPKIRYQIIEKNHRFDLQWWGGYTRHNEIWREEYTEDNQLLQEVLVTENHAIMMYNPLLE